MLSVDGVRRLITAFWERQSARAEVYSRLSDLYFELTESDQASALVLEECLVVFLSLTRSDTSWGRTQSLKDADIWTEASWSLDRKRLLLLLNLVAYFQSRVRTRFLDYLWFLLHYRGLSNTGFHVLHTFGLAPSVRSLGSTVDRVVQQSKVLDQQPCIWWCDNLRRHLKGFLPEATRIDWTVSGRTLVPSLPLYHPDQPALGDLFKTTLLDQCALLVQEAHNVGLSRCTSSYDQATGFSVPLRAASPTKYKFVEAEVLPISCGSDEGTIEMLRFLATRALRTDHYGVAVLDYDLYWRTMKFYHTRSLSGNASS